MSAWHLRRFLAMSWHERRLRVSRLLRNQRQRRAFQRGGARAVVGEPPSPQPFLEDDFASPWLFTPADLRTRMGSLPQAWRGRALTEAREIRRGIYRWLGRQVEFGPRPDWRREAVSGVSFPVSYWTELPVSSSEGVFDLKHLWEPNLHTAFVTLAKAALLEPDAGHREHVLTLWNDWLEQNPLLCGPNYLAPVEIGIRLINWAAALRFLRAAGPLDPAWLASLWPHIHAQRAVITDNLSRGSSANNHLLGELASLVLVDTAFPGLASPTATAQARDELLREVERQFHPDGVNREQALHYHGFSLEFCLLVAQTDATCGLPWPPEVLDRLRRATQFLTTAHDQTGHPFLFGDSDESEVLPLVEGERSPTRSVVALGDGALNQAAISDERLHWLGCVGSEGVSTASPTDPIALFRDGGHAFLRRGPVEVHFNGGALGYLAICAHGHADCGSVVIRHNGAPVTVDPGTYSYRGRNPWREALVRADAHPTLTVDGLQPAERGGPFLWTTRYRATLVEDAESIVVSHTGYSRLGITHRRAVRWDADGSLCVEDTLTGPGTHEVSLHWPLGPGQVELGASSATLRGAGFVARFSVEGFPAPDHHVGDSGRLGTPVVSAGYDTLTNGQTVCWSGQFALPFKSTTRISVTATR